MKYLLKNGTIVTHNSEEAGSILIKGSKILKIFKTGQDLPSVKQNELIDCSNCFVFPGVIDPHVHLRDFSQSYKETINSGTAAAIANGVTTVLGMPNTSPALDDLKNIKAYINKIKESAHCNVGLYARFPETINEKYIPHLKKLGIFGVKVYPGDAPKVLSWELLLDLWNRLKERFNEYIGNMEEFIHKLDVFLDHHYTKSELRQFVENWDPILTELKNQNLHILFHADVPLDSKTREIRFKTFEGIHKSFLKAHSLNHSKLQELLHIYFVFQILRFTPSQNYPSITFCHVSSIEAIELIQYLKKRNPKLEIFTEITPHHTYLNSGIELSIQSHGKVLPPLRTEDDNLKIQNFVQKRRHNDIFFGTDHAPHSLEDKAQKFIKTPPGFPSLDIYTKYVLSQYFENKWDLRNFAFYASYIPAKIYQLRKKGWIHPSYDADLVIVRKVAPYTLDKNHDFLSESPVCPYSLENIQVEIIQTFLNGKVYSNKRVGKYLPRSYKWNHKTTSSLGLAK